jgi:hypothetical protein
MWWRLPLLLLAVLLASGALRTDTVSGLAFAPAGPPAAGDPLASSIAGPGLPAVPGASRSGQTHVEAGRAPAPGAIAADAVPPDRLSEHLQRASYLRPSGVVGREVDVAHPHRGRAPPGIGVTGLS